MSPNELSTICLNQWLSCDPIRWLMKSLSGSQSHTYCLYLNEFREDPSSLKCFVNGSSKPDRFLVVPVRVTLLLEVIFKGVAIGQCALWTETVERTFMVTHWVGLFPMGSLLTRCTHSSSWIAVLKGMHFQWFFVMIPTVWIWTRTLDCNFACAQLYPFQTCSSVCGIVVMAEIACRNLPLVQLMSTSCISQGNTYQPPHIHHQKPSHCNGYLHRVFASWVA